MTTEERLGDVEHSIRDYGGLINLLTAVGERQQVLLERIEQRIEQSEQRIEQGRQQLEEVRQDAAMTRRLWVHLARKNGWLEDEDWPPPQAA